MGVTVGSRVGPTLGKADGLTVVGCEDEYWLGTAVGPALTVGARDSAGAAPSCVGDAEGTLEGWIEGEPVGRDVGCLEGWRLG